MATYDLNLRDYWRIVKKRKFIIIFTFLAMTIFSFISATLTKPVPIFKTNATIKYEAQLIMGIPTMGERFTTSTSGSEIETQIAMIKSYLIMELAAKKMGLIPADVSSEGVRNSTRYINIILDLKSKVEAEQDGTSNMINVIATTNDPKLAQKIANTIAQAYKEQRALDINRKTIEAKKFIENQRIISLEKLATAEEAVKAFREKNKLITFDTQSSNLVNELAKLQSGYDLANTVRQKATQIRSLLNNAENRALTSEQVFYFDAANSAYKNLYDRLVQLMLNRDTLLLSYTDNFPQVKEIKSQIAETVRSMKAQLLAQEKSLAGEMNVLKPKIKEIEEKIKQVPQIGLELTRLERDRIIAQEVYTLLEKRYQETLISESEKLEEVQIVKPALEPLTPINPPNSSKNVMMGMILGLVLGIVFAFLIETFDTSIGAIEEIEDFLGTRVLGIIPFLNIEDVRDGLIVGMPQGVSDDVVRRHFQLISHYLPTSTLAENYRALRTNFNFLTIEKEAKIVVVTSTYPGEGKTTVTCNLAITLAQSGHKVLIIDGDFRKPVISRAFGIDQVPGFTDVILGNYEWQKVIRSISDLMMGKMGVNEATLTPGLDNLYLMTSGTMAPNPAELISSKTVSELIRQMRDAYEIVIIDAPPVLAATDATVWSTKVDGVIMVYQVGRVARGPLQRAKSQLDNVKAQLLGIVLNGLKAEISPDFSAQEKYGYYGYGQAKKQKTFVEKLTSLLPGNLKAIVDKLASLLPGNLKARVETLIERFKGRAAEDNGNSAPIIPRETGKGKFWWLNVMMLIFAVLFLMAGIIYLMSVNKIP